MTRLVAAAIAIAALVPTTPRAEAPADVQRAPSCRHCNMDRDKFA
jgi:hypothetical protein